MAGFMTILSLFCLASSATALISVRDNGRNFLGVGMQPELVAKTLSTVEQEWKDQAAHFIECELQESISHCDSTHKSFHRSCETVVGAIVKASNGETDVTKEYMVDICSQSSLRAWRRDTCIALARDVTMKMTASSYENRVNLKADKVCNNFWSQFLAEQKVLHQKEMDAIKAEKKRAEEEAAEKAKQEKEEAERRRKEELAKEEEKKQKEAELARMRDVLKKSESEAKKKDDEKLAHEEAEVNSLEKKAEEEIQSADQAEKGTESSIKEAVEFEKEEEVEVEEAKALKEMAQKKAPVKAAPVKAAPVKAAPVKVVKKTSKKDATMQRAYDVLAAAEAAVGPKPVKAKKAKEVVAKAAAPLKAAPQKAAAPLKAAPQKAAIKTAPAGLPKVAQKVSKASTKKA